MSSDALAIVLAAAGALALVWAATEVHAYVLWARRGRSGRAPDRWRLRAAVYAALAVLGGLLGLLIGAWLRG